MIKKQSQYNLWAVLPVLFLINLAINAWLWRSLQNNDVSWGVYGRAVFSVAALMALPMSQKIERWSWGKISTTGCLVVICSLIVGILPYNPILLCVSSFFLGLSQHLLMFRTQIEYSEQPEGASRLRNFTMWYGISQMIAPWMAGFWAEYESVEHDWVNIVLFGVLSCIVVFYEIRQTKQIRERKMVAKEKAVSEGSMIKRLWRDAELLRLGRQTLILSGGMACLNVVIPVWAVNNGWTSGDAGFIIGLAGVSSLCIRLLMGRRQWTERYAQIFVQWACWVLAGIFAIWPWVSNWTAGLVMTVLYGLIFGLASPLSLSLYAWVSQRRVYPSDVWASRSAIAASSAIGAPILLGWSISVGVMNFAWTGLGISSLFSDRNQMRKNITRRRVWWAEDHHKYTLKDLPPEDCH